MTIVRERIKKEVEEREFVLERSWGDTSFEGKHKSTLEWFAGSDGGRHGQIEWYVETLDEVEHIGIWWDEDDNLMDYDGIMGWLSPDVILFIEELGIKVGPEFRNE